MTSLFDELEEIQEYDHDAYDEECMDQECDDGSEDDQLPTQEHQIFVFQQMIDKIVEESDITYIEAIAEYCESAEIEPQSVIGLMSGVLMSKVTHEAQKLRLVKSLTPSLV